MDLPWSIWPKLRRRAEALQRENQALREENEALQAKLGEAEFWLWRGGQRLPIE